MTNETNTQVKTLLDQVKGYTMKIVGGVVIAVTLFSSYGYNEGGMYARVQQPIIGYKWVKDEGYYAKLPFLSKTKEFNKNGTIASTDNAPLIEASGITVAPTTAQFADSYEMRFEWSMRYELPVSDEDLEFMYQKLKSQDNMLANTLMPFGQTMFTDSVNQMLGGDFAQGGKNSLRTLVDNQAQHGMYQTKVERIKIKREAGTGSNNTLGGATTDLEVTKVNYILDDSGKRVRTPLSISAYGLKIVPNSFQIVENKPVGRLVEYIKTKQDNQRLQIEQDEKQKILAKQAQTSQLIGEKNLVERTNELNIKKQEAIIAAEQRVAEAGLQADKEKVEAQKVADLAVIDKTRELQIAQANEAIQKANSLAAKHQASAIKQVGFAEAAVDSAKLKAKQDNKVIYIAELNRDIAIQQAQSMERTAITSPNSVVIMGNGEGEDNTSLSDLLNVKLARDITSAK